MKDVAKPKAPASASPMLRAASPEGGKLAALLWLLFSCTSLIFCALLVAVAWWREDQAFWRNSGGYPVWQRELVKITFYPLLACVCLAVMLLTKGLLRGWRGSARTWGLHVLLILLCWLLLAASVCIAWANNVSNLLQDHPLHQHAE
jgi:hypothetical protein